MKERDLRNKRYLGIARCSTDTQTDTSISAQNALVEDFARAQGMVCVGTIELPGVTGSVPGVRTDSEWVARHQRAAGDGRKVTHGTLDIDPFPSEVHGRQPGGACHGYYRQKIYHPLMASFSAGGDYDASRLGEGFVHAILRRGNSSSAEGAVRFVRRVIHQSRRLASHLDVRIDAGLANGRVLDAIDDEGARFVGRIRNNAVLDAWAEPYLKRPPGRPLKEGDEFVVELGSYQAGEWTRPYRVVLVVIDLPDPKTGLRELFPHHFFLALPGGAGGDRPARSQDGPA